MPVMAYPFPGVIEYPDIFVLLCMNEDLFLACFIFKFLTLYLAAVVVVGADDQPSGFRVR